jgi:outer membrane receptor protein involved in Fe transport/Flp pilus assembly protein TadD
LNLFRKIGREILWIALLGCLLSCLTVNCGTARAQSTNRIWIVEAEGKVEVSPVGAATWVLTQTNQDLHPFDRVRSGPNSRMSIRWTGQETAVSFGASTELEILPQSADGPTGLHLIRGILSFFHRDKPGRIRVITRGAVAGVEGTEFVLSVSTLSAAELTTLSVIDGRVSFTNELGSLVLTNGEQAVAEVGKAPVRTAGFIANNLLQWAFYYPAVLDPNDLSLTANEQSALAESLAAYRSGDLIGALAKYPKGREPGSDYERIYYAALLLSVGEVDASEKAMSGITAADPSARPQRLAAALRQLISAVKRQANPSPLAPETATELLAGSYYEQSRAVPDASLIVALSMARQAVRLSPEFGFGWARVAELEFSFGNNRAALEALDKSLALTPRHAQALALKGFLFAARNRPGEAITWFNRAIEADSSLANAWLGRGLSRIRCGDTEGGREDLLVAAALEPQRAELRSYLGKAWADAGDVPRATKEFQQAKNLDPGDPTPWLYSALMNQEHSRINEAIRDLEQSQALNDNRSVYRSRLLLDQDQAVRSANLAAMYNDAGMPAVAVREAVRAVNYDYANYSAHLFLANSYNGYRDPNLINLRYETAAENEYLLATLLSPVSAGTLSPIVSQQEYSSLFERDRLGVVSSTEYLSRGAWTESGAQYGVLGDFGYALEGFYRSDPGQRVNNDITQKSVGLAVQQQITPQDSVFAKVRWYDAGSGDLAQYYFQTNASPTARVDESQKPILNIGYHHEWSPGVHTLFLFGRLEDEVTFTNTIQPILMVSKDDLDGDGIPEIDAMIGNTMHQHYENKLVIYSGELQQIWEEPDHNTIVGGRIQYGDFDTVNKQNLPGFLASFFPSPPTNAADQNISTTFRRYSVYGYHQWQIFDPLQLIGGVSYDWMEFPENFRNPPISGGEQTEDGFFPKAGLIWTPAPGTTMRFAYSQSLAGPTLDQSYRLEPSQVAGFIQSFRSIIPESVAGANAGARFETYGLSLEQKFRTGTYLGITGELLNSQVHRTVGAFDVLETELFAVPSGVREHLDFHERSLLATANQLLGNEWALGAQYRLSHAELKSRFVDVPTSVATPQDVDALLHQLNLNVIFNHPSGFFAVGEAVWYAQTSDGYTPALADEDFWQFNAFVGYRFFRRKASVSLGVLNISDQDYHLNPLNLYNEPPRERTLAVRLDLNF